MIALPRNWDICNVMRGCKSKKVLGTTTLNSCKDLELFTFPRNIGIYVRFLPCRFGQCGPYKAPHPLWLSCWSHWRKSRSPLWTFVKMGLWLHQQTADLLMRFKRFHWDITCFSNLPSRHLLGQAISSSNGVLFQHHLFWEHTANINYM